MEWVLIIIAATTAGFIAWQAWETRRAAQATQRSTEAIERQAGIMDRQTVATEQAAGAAKQSAEAASATVEVLRRTARRELRARVFVVGAKRSGPANPGSFDAEVTIKNFGKVPAYRCTYAFELVLRTNPPGEDAFPPLRLTGQEPKMVLPPDGEVKVVKPLLAGAFGNPQHQQVGAGSHAVYVYGQIQYRDGFQRERFSKFLMRCCGPDYALGRFSFCEKGNEAD